MEFELFRIAVALLGTSAAAYQDYKTSYIDDKIVYAMIGMGIALNLATLNLSVIAFSLGGALLIALAGFLLYKQGQFGGGDILLLAAVQLLLPLAPLEIAQNINASSLVNNELYLIAAQAFPFFITIFITSSLLALLGSSASYARQLAKKKTTWKPEKTPLLLTTTASIAFLAWLNMVLPLTI
ncbi:prepilin peptidase, partial [Candidatus Micrarchaeota archaeon]|nr:prepilin peptidase [Candidatus Micrarchaeota archaeon]